MTKLKKGVLLVNLGTPDSTSTADVRKYLREFLSDGRVIDIPGAPRWALVNLIIAPFRSPKSAEEYRKLWEERGSPLKFYSEDVTELLQKKLGDDYLVVLGMRYQSPSLKGAIDQLMEANVSSIKVIPLFPQYASATTGSVIERVMELVKDRQIIPQMSFVSQFVDHPLLTDTFADLGRIELAKDDYDHILFSYHGLPERQIRKGSVDNHCQLGSCCDSLGPKNQLCYRALCFETSRKIVEKLNIPEDKYTVCFQSRLGRDPWVQPYTEDMVGKLAERGVKKVLAFSPAFVADCLETTVEVGETYAEEFVEKGGEKWTLVPSLNTNEKWIECLADLSTT
ncbi:MAG: ferrochelatase [Cyclobacteriaceae bacterium]